MTQGWHDLLFIHSPIAPEVLRPLLPPQLELDTFDGQAWVGIVPFRATHTSFRWLPPFPLLSHFPEVNVRTYVTMQGIPGVYFFSLDAGSPLAVLGARTVFHLPYFFARMRIKHQQETIYYWSQRMGTRKPAPAYEASYHPNGPVFFAQRGTLEYWLIERYCLYTVTEKNRVYRVDIHHDPWPLQSAGEASKSNTMASAQGIPLPDQPPLLHYAQHQDVLFWPLRRIL